MTLRDQDLLSILPDPLDLLTLRDLVAHSTHPDLLDLMILRDLDLHSILPDLLDLLTHLDPLDLTLPRDPPPLTRDTLQEAHTNLLQSHTDPATVLTSTTDSTVPSAVASVAVASVATMTTVSTATGASPRAPSSANPMVAPPAGEVIRIIIMTFT